MKNRTMGILLGIISVVFSHLETVYFGNNWTSQSTAEWVCDITSLLMTALAVGLMWKNRYE